MRRHIVAIALATFFVIGTSGRAFAGFAIASQDATHYYIENDVLKIAFLRTNGSLDGIIHKQSGVDLQSMNVNNFKGLWGMSLNTASGVTIPFVGNANAMSFSAAISTTTDGAALVMTWRGLRPASVAAMPNVVVRAQISVRADSPLSNWTIEGDGFGADAVVSISYPFIPGVGPIGDSGEDDVLLLPIDKGTLFHNPTANVPQFAGGFYPSASASIQMLSYFDRTAGLYIASDDTQGYTKNIYWASTSSPAHDFSVVFQHYLNGTPSDHVAVPYNLTVGVTQGDWYAPAETYRVWANQQLWTQQSHMKRVPTWLHDMPVVRWDCTHRCGYKPDQSYSDFLAKLQRSNSDLGVTGMGSFAGWEKFGKWVEGDYFPPQEGWSGFDAAIQQSRPGKLWLFPSALVLDTATDVYRIGTMKASAMLDQQGAERTTTSASILGSRWVFMDVSTDPWRQYMVDTYATLANHGVDLLNLDSSVVFGPQDCYNPSHTHPPGKGGNWQTLGWIDVSQRIANAVFTANPNAALSAESPSEVYLPYFVLHQQGGPADAYEVNSLTVPTWERVPLFQYVYHDSILFADFIQGAWFDGSYFRLELARDLTWGQIPVYQIPAQSSSLDASELAYLRNAIAARTTYANKFLVDGVMLASPVLNVPLTPVTWVVSQNNTPVTGLYPSIQESAWRASDGSIGIVLTNIASNPITFSLPIVYGRLGLAIGTTYKVEKVSGGSVTTPLDGNMATDSTYSLSIDPQQVILVRLTPNAVLPLRYDPTGVRNRNDR